MDLREFAEWKAAYRVQPWGDDWAQAQLLADMQWRGTTPPAPNWAIPTRFGIGITKPPEGERQSATFVMHSLDQFFHAHNANVKGGRSG